MTILPERVISKKIGELLLERKIIKEPQLTRALQAQQKMHAPLGSILVLLGYTTEEQVAQALTSQFGYPYLPLAGYDLNPEIVKLIPKDTAKHYNLIAVDKIGGSLSIAVSDPFNIHGIKEDVEPVTNCKVYVFISTQTDIEKSIKKYYGPVVKR